MSLYHPQRNDYSETPAIISHQVPYKHIEHSFIHMSIWKPAICDTSNWRLHLQYGFIVDLHRYSHCDCPYIVRAEYECFQIELSKNYGLLEWREDIKSIMLKAGLQNVQITFLFVDTQVRL